MSHAFVCFHGTGNDVVFYAIVDKKAFNARIPNTSDASKLSEWVTKRTNHALVLEDLASLPEYKVGNVTVHSCRLPKLGKYRLSRVYQSNTEILDDADTYSLLMVRVPIDSLNSDPVVVDEIRVAKPVVLLLKKLLRQNILSQAESKVRIFKRPVPSKLSSITYIRVGVGNHTTPTPAGSSAKAPTPSVSGTSFETILGQFVNLYDEDRLLEFKCASRMVEHRIRKKMRLDPISQHFAEGEQQDASEFLNYLLDKSPPLRAQVQFKMTDRVLCLATGREIVGYPQAASHVEPYVIYNIAPDIFINERVRIPIDLFEMDSDQPGYKPCQTPYSAVDWQRANDDAERAIMRERQRLVNASSNVTVMKRTSLSDLGDFFILRFTLEKYDANTGSMSKIAADNMLASVLDEFEHEGKRYQIVGKIYHQGNSLHSGHYFADIQYEDGWYRMNDNEVKRMARPSVAKPFMIMYKRVEVPFQRSGSGIANIGNSCYANSALQFVRYLIGDA